MNAILTPVRWCARICGLVALVLGGLIGRVPSPGIIHGHMTLGGLVLLCLLVTALLSAGKVAGAKVGLAIGWTAVALFVALKQGTLMPGGSHWVIGAVHAVLGVGAIGLVEMLAAARARVK